MWVSQVTSTSTPEPKRIILVETKVIRVSLIRERKDAGRQRVPCVRRNRIERLSQLCRKRWFLLRSAVNIRSVVAVGIILRRHSHACITTHQTIRTLPRCGQTPSALGMVWSSLAAANPAQQKRIAA